MIKKLIFNILILCLPIISVNAQDEGVFSGGFQMNANVFLRDSLIGAANIPQYDNEIFGGEAWLDLNYAIKGYEFSLRYDMFNNSNLLNPNSSYTDQGIGRWHIGKQLNKLYLKVGHIYDQIGSGTILRAWEERAQLIDNAIYGLSLNYAFNDDWHLKAIAGKQRFLFDKRPGTIKALNLDGFLSLSENSHLAIAPGIGFVNRTYADETMDRVVSILTGYQEVDRFKPKYNVYLGTLYNTLSVGKVSWYIEGSLKSDDVFFDPTADRTLPNFETVFGKFERESGSVLYTSLSYAGGGFGITVEAKRTENFNFKTDPTLALINGVINYLPAMTRQNTYRLTTRYQPATQDLSEQAFQIDAKYKISKSAAVSLNGSYIDDLNGKKLYREVYADVTLKKSRKYQLIAGLQMQEYNQELYEVKPDAPIVQTITPFVDYLHKISRKKSIRAELQYLLIGDDNIKGGKQDYGNWVFGLVEYSIAPHWSFTASDMFNISPGVNSPKDEDGKKLGLHYPRFDVYFTQKMNRYSFSYVKQVEGIICSGGVCRLEPAFSGFKFGISSNF